VTGVGLPIDLGFVNGYPMLNTSAVGAYADFVRYRRACQRWLGYWIASGVAAVGVWLRRPEVELELLGGDGTRRRIRTPLLFVGVQERILGRAGLGRRAAGGARALHVVVVNEPTRSRTTALVRGALADQSGGLVRADAIEAGLVPALVAVLPRATGTIAVDGELLRVHSPLRYEYRRGAALVVR
jgi:hypothetical protein